MENDRIKRLKLFEEFQNQNPNFFEQKKLENKYKKFDDYYSLCICPKGRNGGISNRLYEIFYGRRIYGIEEQLRSDLSTQKKQLTETGCTLAFGLNDHGYVAIMLYPGKTDYTSQIESCIFIKNYIHPKKLQNLNFLQKQWNYFNSYMEITSIDGNPTFTDKCRVFYLRRFKNKIVDDKYQEKPIVNSILTSLRYILNIGLSGFIIYLLTVLPNIKSNQKTLETNKEIELLKTEIKTLKKEILNLEKVNSIKKKE
ncbi:hypothetical protein JSO61_009215 [Riemerella anatipestifer]|uniref:hypothetical protein n=1 Tax=Riemerella anatipestifer TaxID=34085 RepID=UPI0030BCB82E